MELKVYNSLTNTIEEFICKNNEVKMYVCGPTVYNYIHLGNARPVIFFDMFKRYLQYLNHSVTYACNITDIDDKIIKKAKDEGVTEVELATKFSNIFLDDIKKLNCLPFDYTPKATDYITDMIAFIDELIKKDYAYTVNGNVYFNVKKALNYGKLSNQKIEDLNDGVRINVNNDKKNQVDFTLWKKTNDGIKWEAPFSLGRPGWHTECATMIYRLFKGGIDLHGGGFDLKFPHHENEIAQFEIMYQENLANYFMHVGRLDFNGEKMSKSLGNVVLVNDLKTTEELMSFRLLILMHKYRSSINYSSKLFDDFKKDYDKIIRILKQANLILEVNKIVNNNKDITLINEFKTFMNDDFNTPNVFTLIQRIVKELNLSIRNNELVEVNTKYNSLLEILNVLGFDLKRKTFKENEIDLYNKWLQLRENKLFEDADKVRLQLLDLGVL